jgi:DNA-binding SARP family transcriptional activator
LFESDRCTAKKGTRANKGKVMKKYFLHLMGPPNLRFRGENAAFEGISLKPASIALLSFLATPGHRGGIARGRLAEILSPGCDPRKSSSRLSSAICRLRQGLGRHGDMILRERSGGQIISLSPDVVTDMAELAQARDALVLVQNDANIDRLEDALQARSGDFLDGLTDSWAEDARQVCLEIYESALELLIAVHRTTGDVDRSISAARSLIREDPYREDIHAVLLELYGRKGLRHRAAAHYNGCCKVLKSDLGVDPGDRLQSSLRAALNAGPLATPEMSDLHGKLRDLDRSIRAIASKVDRLFEKVDGDQAKTARDS